MLDVQISIDSGARHIFNVETPLTVDEIQNRITELTAFLKEEFYAVHNGLLVQGNDICRNGNVTFFPRLFGGKGGFGSMLRAIGAQIEKTTNREACRDLSGRRLRDINEEKRLKAWIEQKGKREEEAAERKKKKLERLCAQPKHEFKDQCYERERSVLTERVGDAVEEGLKAATARSSGIKRKIDEEVKPKQRKTLLDLDIDSDELDSSDDSDDGEVESKKMRKKEQQVSNDSGHSSDESGRTSKGSNPVESEYSEASSDNHNNDENLNKKDTMAETTPMEAEESVESSSAPPKEECIEQTVQDK